MQSLCAAGEKGEISPLPLVARIDTAPVLYAFVIALCFISDLQANVTGQARASPRPLDPVVGQLLLSKVPLFQNPVRFWIGLVEHTLNLVNHPLENVSVVLRRIQEFNIRLPMFASCFGASVLLSDVR